MPSFVLLRHTQPNSMTLFFWYCPTGIHNLTGFEGERRCSLIRAVSGNEGCFASFGSGRT